MEPIYYKCSSTKMPAMFGANPWRAIANINYLFSLTKTASARLKQNMPTKSLGPIEAADITLVPLESLIFEVNTANFSFVPGIRFMHCSAIYDHIQPFGLSLWLRYPFVSKKTIALWVLLL